MICNLSGGRIYRGSIAQIDVFLYSPCIEASGVVANFYTVTGTSIEKSDMSISGGIGTVVFQPVELEALQDGLLRYNVSYEVDGEPYQYDYETRYFIKTPMPYTPIDYVTSDELEQQVSEAISSETVVREIQTQVEQSITGKADTTAVTQALSTKQDTLVSGTNIKTINNQNILGSGNIEIQGGTGATYTAGTNIDITNNVISVTGISVPTSNTALTNDAGYITSQDIPTSNTAFTNDAGYITGVSIPTSNTAFTNDAGYVTSGEVQTQINDSISGKQDTLISGTNIKTINNQNILGEGNITIEGGGTGVTYSAGTNIDITNNVISVTGITSYTGITSQDVIQALGYTPCMVTAMTQTQYSQLETKDANTIYGITGD